MASIRARLLDVSKARGESYDLTLTRYALERFLYRVSQSEARTRLILKGATMFYVWEGAAYRATRDLDFLARGELSLDALSALIRAVCEVTVEPDGITFDLGTLSLDQIREEAEYGGLRARFIARLGTAEIPVRVDIGLGDAVSPIEVRFPTLLGMEEPQVLAYPKEAFVAEKLDIIVNLGMANSRLKDYFDLWMMASNEHLDSALLSKAIRETFDRRLREIPIEVPVGLSDAFAKDAMKSEQWRGYLARISGHGPELIEVVKVVREYAMPLFRAARS